MKYHGVHRFEAQPPRSKGESSEKPAVSHAPVSERIRTLSMHEKLQLRYATVRDIAYDPDGWQELEGAIDDHNYESKINAEDHGKIWMTKMGGNRAVYKLTDSTPTNPVAEDFDALIAAIKQLPPEMREDLLPKGFAIRDSLTGESRLDGSTLRQYDH